MYLKQLEIQGFKSFPDKLKITFEKGITAVVGPNGSGKSNISDAIRWVLGETSARQLRGGGKMENVIFGGTQTRNAMGYTSVKIVLDNADSRLDINANEVVIARKYYRSGESEYSINGQHVRLKDIYELLLDTGLGRDGYSVISQGKIAEIINAKNKERREIFEEASGIARYRYRKNEAERRLALAQENLLRLNDIFQELEAQVIPLEKESEKAKQFLSLTEQKKALEVTLWVQTIKHTQQLLQEQKIKIATAQQDYNHKKRDVENIEQSTQNIRDEIEKLIIDIDLLNQQVYKQKDDMAKYASSKAVINNNIQHNMARIEQLMQEINKNHLSKKGIDDEIEAQQEQIQQKLEHFKQMNQEIETITSNLQAVQQDIQSINSKKVAIQQQIDEKTQQLNHFEIAQATQNSLLETTQKRFLAVQEGLAHTTGEIQTVEANIEQEDKQLQDLIQDNNVTVSKADRLQKSLNKNEIDLQKNQDALYAQQRSIDKQEQQLALLQEMENNMEGYSGSIKAVIQAAQKKQLQGIIGTVSSLITVKEGFEIAIEVALGASVQNIVVKSSTDAQEAIYFLKKIKSGRATFLPLNTIKAKNPPTNLPSNAVSAKTLVEYDEQYVSIISNLLERIVVVKSMEEATQVAKLLHFKYKVVSHDGQIINPGGSYTGGSNSRKIGVFSRQQEIKQLQAGIQKKSEKINVLQVQSNNLQLQIKDEKHQLNELNQQVIAHSEEQIRHETYLQTLQQTHQSKKDEQTLLKIEHDELKSSLNVLENQKKVKSADNNTLLHEIKQLSLKFETVCTNENLKIQEQEEYNQQLSNKNLQAVGVEKDIELNEQQISSLKERTSEGTNHQNTLQQEIKTCENQNKNYAKELKALDIQADKVKQEIVFIQKDSQDLANNRIQKEGLITQQLIKEREAVSEREQLGQEIARLNEQNIQLEEEYDKIIAQLWEDYELGLSEAQKICVAFKNLSQLKADVNELKASIKALGSVHVGAIEKYKELEKRYSFLKTQIQDIQKSKQALESMIAQLSNEMTDIFTAKFEAINQHFGEIFITLFGGGEARLILSEPENVLETGIDIEVNPPGKSIKDLSALSGGEKALVSVCIYFAILAVNPAPFCVLDEIEAALDDVNVVRYAQYLRLISDKTQFIVITHRRGTMEEADVLYGVTMQEDGVSKILRLKVDEIDVQILV